MIPFEKNSKTLGIFLVFLLYQMDNGYIKWTTIVQG
jgi:hypothetical protein